MNAATSGLFGTFPNFLVQISPLKTAVVASKLQDHDIKSMLLILSIIPNSRTDE